MNHSTTSGWQGMMGGRRLTWSVKRSARSSARRRPKHWLSAPAQPLPMTTARRTTSAPPPAAKISGVAPPGGSGSGSDSRIDRIGPAQGSEMGGRRRVRRAGRFVGGWGLGRHHRVNQGGGGASMRVVESRAVLRSKFAFAFFLGPPFAWLHLSLYCPPGGREGTAAPGSAEETARRRRRCEFAGWAFGLGSSFCRLGC